MTGLYLVLEVTEWPEWPIIFYEAANFCKHIKMAMYDENMRIYIGLYDIYSQMTFIPVTFFPMTYIPNVNYTQ